MIVEPISSRADLATVIALYKPQYYFDDRPNDTDRAQFEPGELQLIASGNGWRLSKITTLTEPLHGDASQVPPLQARTTLQPR